MEQDPVSTGPTDLPQTPVFATTRWTLVVNAGDTQAPEHADALAQLCGTYWYPLYAYVRQAQSSS